MSSINTGYGNGIITNFSININPRPVKKYDKTDDFNENLITETINHEVELVEKPKVSRIYGADWVVMQNRMIFAISNLTLQERRLVLFLSPLVRQAVDKNPSQRSFVVRVKDFNEYYGVNVKSQYDILKMVNKSIMHKFFTYWDFDENGKDKTEVDVVWFTKARYQPKSGEIHIELHDDVINMLTVFDKNNHFTKYQKDMIINLGTYGLILLELMASFINQNNKQAIFTMEYIREKFNCVDKYSNIAEFKRNVLDVATKELKKFTPYEVSYETLSQAGGRKITHFKFKVNIKKSSEVIENKEIKAIEEKKKNKGNEIKSNGLSDKQINKLKQFAQEFVDLNKARIAKHEESMQYEAIIDSWKPMLQNTNYLYNYKGWEEILKRK